jgi:hypothetical protein
MCITEPLDGVLAAWPARIRTGHPLLLYLGPPAQVRYLFIYSSVILLVFHSVSDSEPRGCALILFGWILIRFANADPDPGGQK